MRFREAFLMWVFPAILIVRSLHADDAVDFNRDVRPILAKHCYTCHGPDDKAREAGLRLDVRDSAVEDRGGYLAIDVEDPDASEILVRILSEDPDTRMPPGDEAKRLSDVEIETLKQWIDEGAFYQQHWTFIPPRRSSVPKTSHDDWCREPIDRYIAAKIEAAGLEPSDEADCRQLIRRLYLDLTGLSPEPDVVERFVHDTSPKSLRRLIDELLASPAYGEHMATTWLDLARYADTNGYEKDRPRTIWPYRDWVIDALNQDMPFDQFSVEQLAGDMLPAATPAQRIATGFHRNTMLNEEGGIDPLEYRFYAMIDRVATTGTVWLGLTTGCAQCHTHKYDPITHEDFYSLYALLNNADEPELELISVNESTLRQQILSDIDASIDELVERFLNSSSKTEEAATVRTAFDQWLEEQLRAARDWTI